MGRVTGAVDAGNQLLEEEMIVQVKPVIDTRVRSLCRNPYPLHPRGCPNYGEKSTCPPKAPLYEDIFNTGLPVYAVVNEYDLGSHVAKMRAKHPKWSYRQLYCVIYWQGTARKQLRKAVKEALKAHRGYIATYCPEAMGVDVTETLKAAGVWLEWPAKKIARQVAFLARKREPQFRLEAK